jgi:hypothetical protein
MTLLPTNQRCKLSLYTRLRVTHTAVKQGVNTESLQKLWAVLWTA